MSTAPPANLLPALELLRRGDRAGAQRAVEAALAEEPDSPALLGFAGLLAAQAGDTAAAIPYFRRALAAAPDDLPSRINLATALISMGELDEAGAVCAVVGGDMKLLRLGAYVHQASGRMMDAEAAYRQVVAAFPQDFESWNNLGNVRQALGDADGAVAAFQQAIRLRGDIVEIVINLSDALAAAERHDERFAVMREAARIGPDNVAVQTELGLAASSVHAFDVAERAYREAIRLDPKAMAAWLELGLLLENLNRVDELDALVGEAEARGLTGAELGFIKAWALRRQGRFAEALPLAEATPATIHPVRRAQLLAELYDRLGRSAEAFAMFEEMNRAALDTVPVPAGLSYRESVVAATAMLTGERVAAWTRIEVAPEPPAPIFIVGFPRSGTTLLDTLLMNIPDFHILEELPVLRDVEAAIPPDGDLGLMTSAEARTLRDYYFDRVRHHSPGWTGGIVVDKHPLHMARMPLIQRIFPDAKIIIVERHPCDASLSCFMANFQLNLAMRSFTSLMETARTYDAVFEAWSRAEALLPLDVHRVRYERMVEDLEGEMRALLAFLGRDWDPAVLDNRASAATRGHVRTASYAQVTEPIYKRSAGRWERYRAELAPVLPILAPWVERLGYPALETGAPDAADLIEPASGDVDLWRQHLAGLMFGGRHEEILEAVGRGRASAGAHPVFDLAEAVAHDDLGQRDAAAPLFAAMAESADPAVAFYRVRHLFRAGAIAEASALAERWQDHEGGRHFTPYLALAWRLTGDPRWQWLEGDSRLVGIYDLADEIGPLEPLAALLRGMHEGAGQLLGQSVRGGTQVPEPLASDAPEIAPARDAILRAVARHIAQLPPVDPDHPTLRHRRDAPVQFTGSWSVRLSGAGYHIAHVHPNGWLSSAFYVALPEALAEAPPAGWLTLGEPPVELGLDLPPLRMVEPKPGRLVLFPSTMWHGTLPFASGERLTIAFDVA